MDACPTLWEWKQFAVGGMDANRTSQLRTHLEHCASCRQVVGSSSVRPTPTVEHRDDSSRVLLTQTAPEGTRPQGAVPVSDETVDVPSAPQQIANRCLPRIDGYQITGVVGQGGMGIVYRAVETALNRAVALKVLPAMIGSASSAAVERFRREARAAADLHHTNIIPIYRYGESHDAYYYAMELVTGQPLNKLIERLSRHQGSLGSPARLTALVRDDGSEVDIVEPSAVSGSVGTTSAGKGKVYYQQVARWMADAADALSYAHGKGVVHRDVKPSNLILSTDGRIMLADFGLAKSAGEESITIVGSLIGTVRYLSPEQAMAKRIDVDHRTDIYSLGATLYELLCFQPAYPGDDEKKILAAIMMKEPLAPRKVLHGVPGELETICLKALEKSPDARYATARAMAEDLRRYLDDLPIVAKRPGLFQRGLKFIRRHKAPATIAVAAGILLIGAGGLLLSSRGDMHKSRIERILEKAKGAVASDLWGEAEKAIDEALALDPTRVRTLVIQSYAAIERFKKQPYAATPQALNSIENACRKVLEQQPDNGNAMNYLGIILKKQGRLPEAIEVTHRLVNAEPNNFPALTNLGAYYALTGQLDNARKFLTAATALAERIQNEKQSSAENIADPWRALASVDLATQDPQVVEHVTRALLIKSDDMAARLIFARAYLEVPAIQNAEEALAKASAADAIAVTADPIARRLLALAALRMGDFQRAAGAARDALKLKDVAAFDQLIIALAEVRIGRIETAKSAYAEALRVWPQELVTSEFWATYDQGVLWIESAGVWNKLRGEVETLLKTGESGG